MSYNPHSYFVKLL